jgi:hypothetical protein
MEEMIRSRRQPPPPPSSWQQTNVIVNNNSSNQATTTEGSETHARPNIIGTTESPPGTKREVNVGFVFLRNGHAVWSRLHHYTAVKDVTVEHDTWLIEGMTDFYTNHVATRRWISGKKRLALAKFVRVGGYLSYLRWEDP